jgi:hypothetical protein
LREQQNQSRRDFMSWYLYRLLPHRPDFATTMTESELEVMGRHVAYWRSHVTAQRVLIFSPVADPGRSWGLAIVQCDEGELDALRAGDPAVRAGIADADFLSLPMAITAETA